MSYPLIQPGRAQAPSVSVLSARRQGRLTNYYIRLPFTEALRACEAGASHVIIEPHNDGWLVTPVTSQVVRDMRQGR